MVQQSPVAMAELDADLLARWANPAFARLFALPPGDAAGREVFDRLDATDRAELYVPTTEGPVIVTCDGPPDGDGARHAVRITLVRAPEERVTVLAYAEVVADERETLRNRFAQATTQFAALFHNLTDVITVCDASGRIIAMLPETDAVLGWPRAQLEERTMWELCHPDERPEAEAAFSLMLESPGVPINREFRALHADGSWAWLSLTGVNLLTDPHFHSVVVISRNITEQRRSEALQRNQSEIFELIACGAAIELVLARIAQLVEENMQGAHAGVFVLGDDVLRWGISPRVPSPVVDAITGTGRHDWFGAIAGALHGRRTTVVEDVHDHPGYEHHIELMDQAGLRASAAAPVDNADDDEPAGVLVAYYDAPRYVTETDRAVLESAARLAAIALQRHGADERLSHMAHHDKLTGLPNRALLQEKLDEGIRHARQHGSSMAVMFLDLDNFKIVNDSFGHAAGDLMLVGFAERLRALVRPGDIIGRFGGDEFVMLLEHVQSAEDAIPVAERLLEDLRRPFHINGNNVFLTVSVGVAVSQRGRDSGAMLLRNADSAMYRAKGRGRSRIEVYADDLPEHASQRLQLEGELREAIDRGEFSLRWQPKISLATGRIVSAEALVRWDHPTRGLLEPAAFISVAEEIEIIDRIGEWVLAEAIGQRAAWEAEHGDEAPWSIAVNVSALQLSAPRASETVRAVLERFDWPPERLVLELTESVLMDEVSEAAPVLLKLKQIGVCLAIDDFGTGYSSLSYLHRFPVDQVKLDRSFVDGIRDDGEGSPIARAVINMAHALGISVTAEGVETQSQMDGLRRLGCDRVQGYLFGKPMLGADFATLLHRKPRYLTDSDAAA